MKFSKPDANYFFDINIQNITKMEEISQRQNANNCLQQQEMMV